MEGWVKLHRKFISWEWFTTPDMVHLFVYLLLMANREDNSWQGIQVKRGQLITGRKKLSEQTGISERRIRTCLQRLQNTGELTSISTSKHSVITICNYDDYQSKQTTSDQQNVQPPTSNRPAIDHKQEGKELKDIIERYHLLCPRLPKIAALSEVRKSHIRARVNEFGIDKFYLVLEKVGNSDFMAGDNDRNWRPTIDWIITPNNFLKILEGKYDNKQQQQIIPTFKAGPGR